MQASTADLSPAAASGSISGNNRARSQQFAAFAGAALRDPLMPFLAAGALLFAGYFAIESGRQDPIRFSPEAEAAMVDDFETLTGRKATAEDRARMKTDYITRELLFRDAIDRNLHLTSPEAREMLVEKERYLIAGAPGEPTEQEMVDFYSEHLDRYQGDPKTTFTQVFLSEKPANPSAVLGALEAGDPVKSDDFWLGRNFPQYGDSMVRGIFGQDFVDRMKSAPEGRWTGPVQSSRGWHFVRVTARQPSQRIPYATIRDQVRQDVMNDQTSAAIDKAVVQLKEKYDVVED